MGKARNPRHGSMQYWPRVKAKKETPVVGSWAIAKDAKPLGFAGYKVGMTHVQYVDEDKGSPTKGEIVNVPVTILECPPLFVWGIRAYKTAEAKSSVVADIVAEKADKQLGRTLSLPKNKSKLSLDSVEYDYLMLVVHTQPQKTTIGKKRPELFEVGLGGSKEDQLTYAKEQLGKTIAVKDVLAEGEFLDVHSVTKGKGYQGPVKRFGVGVRAAKSEGTKRGPGSLGGWTSQAHVMYRVAHAGQMGYHTRTTYNQQLFKIGDDPTQVNAKGGFIRYGVVKNDYVLVKGSCHGATKRLVRINKAIRASDKKRTVAPNIAFISTGSKQGSRVKA